MSYMPTGGPAYGAYPAPNGNPGMMNHQNRQYGPPRFNNSCPWGPPPERHNFNINRFMRPPHVQRHDFVPDNTFRQETMTGPHENFPFISHQNNHQANGQQFQRHPGWGRGFQRGHHGGQGFRGGFRGGFQNNNNNNNKQPNHTNGAKKKEKVDKRDLPENNAHFCDICERGFKSLEKFQEHVDGHSKCSFKDCPFVAAPKLVQLHMKMQHTSGFAKKVWSLESEEDVKKWRDERKRKFPTADTVAKKEQERAEKIARGEIIHTKEFGKMRGRGRNRHERRGRGRGNGKWNNRHGDRNYSESRSECGSGNDSPPEEIKVQKSGPADELLGGSELHKTETPSNGDGSSPQISPKKESLLETSDASLSLLASYGDSSSDGELQEGQTATGSVPDDQSTLTLNQHSGISSALPTEMKLPNQLPPILSSSTTKSAQPQTFLNGTECLQKVPSQEASNVMKSPAKNTVHSSHITPLPTESATAADHTNSENISQEFDASNETGKDSSDKGGQRHESNRHQKGGKRGRNSEKGDGPQSKKKKESQQSSKYTLLQKLLAPDIRKERNKILQCVHYLVKNKFFLKEQASKQDLVDTEPAN